MVSLMRRRAMMQAAAAETEPTYSMLNKSVTIKNGRSASQTFNCVLWHDSIILRSYTATVSSNGTKAITNFATDGTHFWVFAGNCTTVTYNNSPATFSRSSNYFMVTIPDNFDESIPFVFS